MRIREPLPRELKRARALYDDGKVTLRAIAAQLGLSHEGFLKLRRRHQWPPRPQRSPVKKDGSSMSEQGREVPGEVGIDADSLRRKLARAVRREIARVEHQIDEVAPPGADRRARVLASLARTLADLRRLDGGGETSGEAMDGGAAQEGDHNPIGGDPDAGNGAEGDQPRDQPRDQPPRDLAALRQALVDRLEELRRGGPAG